MSVVRHNQPGITRLLPHQGNRRYAIPNRAGGAGQSFRNIIADGDSVFSGAAGTSPVPSMTTYDSVVNDAGSGAELFSVGNQMAATIAANPGRDVLVHAGINDVRNGRTIAEQQESLEDCWQACEAAGVAFAFCSALPSSDSVAITPTEWTDFLTFRAWAEEQLRLRGHAYWDPRATMQDPSNPDTLLPAYRSGGTDPLHLSPEGAQKFAENLDALIVQARLKNGPSAGVG